MMKMLFRFILFCGLLSIILGLSLMTIAATETGSRGFINWLVKTNDIPLTVKSIEGRLLDKLILHELHYAEQGIDDIKLVKLELDWSISDLLQLEVRIQKIALTDLVVRSIPSTESNETFQLPILKLPSFPLTVYIDDLSLNKAQVFSGDTEILIQQFKASATLNNERLSFQLDDLLIDEQQFNGEILITENNIPAIKLALNWSGVLDKEPVDGKLHIDGTQEDLVVDVHISSVIEMLASGRLNLSSKTTMGEIDGELKGKFFDSFSETIVLDTPLVFKIKGDTEQASIEVDAEAHTAAGEKFKFKFNAEAVLLGTLSKALNIHVNWETSSKETDKPLLELSGQGDFTLADQILSIDHDLHIPDVINLSGKVDLSTESVDLITAWDDLKLPLSESDSLHLKSGLLKVGGKLNAVSLLLKSDYLIDSKTEENSAIDSSELVYSNLSAEGKIDLSKTYPIGQLSGNLNTPIPAIFADVIKEINVISFVVESDLDSVNLSIDSNIRTNKDVYFDLGFKSNLDLSSSESSKLMLFDWVARPKEDKAGSDLTGEGSILYQNDQITFKHASAMPYSSLLSGDIFLEDTTRLKIELNWRDFELPFEDISALESKQGQVHIEGPLTALTISADGLFQVEPLGSFDLNLDALWSGTELTLNRLEADVIDGSINVVGAINLQETAAGSLQFDARNLNFGKINPDLDSRVNITSVLDFTKAEDELSTNLNIESITGQWRGFPLKGVGKVAYAKDILHIDHLHFESGNNTLDLNLKTDELMTGLAEIFIDDFSVFSSELAGKIEGRLDISGKPDTPIIKGTFTGERIHLEDIRLTSLSADTRIDLSPQQRSSVFVKLNALSYKNKMIDELLINGNGLTESHLIELTASGPEFNFKSNINGGLEDKHWTGRINQFDLMNKDLGEWQLSHPANINWQVENKIISLTEACMSQNEANLCATGTSELNQGLRGDIKLNRLPLKFADPWLPETMRLNGDVSGDLSFRDHNQQLQMEVLLEGRDTQVALVYADDVELLDIETVSIKGAANQDNKEVSINLTSSGYFDLSLSGAMSNNDNHPLQVALDFKVDRLDWLEKLEPALSGSRGSLQAQMMVAGTIDRPEIEGSFSLEEGKITILPIGLELDKIKGEIKSDDAINKIKIESILGSQNKELVIKGNVSLIGEEDYPYLFNVVGDAFPVIRTADVSADMSPDINLSGTQKLHYIKGKLTIPLLDIIVTSNPSGAVSISPDVVVIQSKEVGADHTEDSNMESDFLKNKVDLNLNILLAPEIHIQAFGLDTRLDGDINIVKPVGLYQPRGVGEIKVKEGSYLAYGQHLEIEQGRLQFAGPLDNPSLNIRAFRPALDVKAGINVSGNVRKPELTLYSEPAQTDADTLSYIITGGPISSASGGEASIIQAAMATEHASVLTNKVKETFHLDEFSLGAGETADSTSFSASKRIAPDLNFLTSFNPFDQLWSFMLNYKLTDNWSVQTESTESGVSQGADIIYSIESNSKRDLYHKIFDLIRF